MLTHDLFIHHVYFWLENPTSTEDHAALLFYQGRRLFLPAFGKSVQNWFH